MRRFPLSRIAGLAGKALSVVLLCGPAFAAEPEGKPAPRAGEIIPVQALPPIPEAEQPAPRTTVAPSPRPIRQSDSM